MYNQETKTWKTTSRGDLESSEPSSKGSTAACFNNFFGWLHPAFKELLEAAPHLQRCQSNRWHCFQATAVWPPNIALSNVIIVICDSTAAKYFESVKTRENPWKPTSLHWLVSRNLTAPFFESNREIQYRITNTSASICKKPILRNSSTSKQLSDPNQEHPGSPNPAKPWCHGTSHHPSSPWSHGGCLVQMAANSSRASLAIDRPDSIYFRSNLAMKCREDQYLASTLMKKKKNLVYHPSGKRRKVWMCSLILSYFIWEQSTRPWLRICSPPHSQSMLWPPRRCECLSLAMTFAAAESNIKSRRTGQALLNFAMTDIIYDKLWQTLTCIKTYTYTFRHMSFKFFKCSSRYFPAQLGVPTAQCNVSWRPGTRNGRRSLWRHRHLQPSSDITGYGCHVRVSMGYGMVPALLLPELISILSIYCCLLSDHLGELHKQTHMGSHGAYAAYPCYFLMEEVRLPTDQWFILWKQWSSSERTKKNKTKKKEPHVYIYTIIIYISSMYHYVP